MTDAADRRTDTGFGLAGSGSNLLPVWSTVGLFLLIQVVDQLLSEQWGLFVRNDATRLDYFEAIQLASDVVFLTMLVAVVAAALLRTRPTWMNRLVVAYLVVATANLTINVANLVLTAQLRPVEELRLLGDLGLIYANAVMVFAVWYRLLDAHTDGGAFEFPEDANHPDRQLGWVDYVFLSFNTNATFGPTLETPHSRTAKLLMMVQTALSLLILVVLVARIVGLDR